MQWQGLLMQCCVHENNCCVPSVGTDVWYLYLSVYERERLTGFNHLNNYKILFLYDELY